MKPKPPAAASEAPPPRRRRWRVWLRRVWRLLWGSTVVLVLVAGAGYYFRLGLANYLLHRSVPGLPASVGALDWENGAVVLKNVRFGQQKDGKPPILAVDRVLAPWSQQRTLGRVVIESPVLHLDAEGLSSLQALLDQGSKNDTKKAKISPSGGFSLDGLEIRDADLHYTGPDGRKLEATLQWQGEAISQLADGALAIQKQRLELHPKAGALLETGMDAVPPLTVAWSLDAAARKLLVHEIKTSRPGRLLLEPELLALLTPKAEPQKVPPAPPVATVVTAARSVIESVEIEAAAVDQLQVVLPMCPGLEKALEVTLSLTASVAAEGKATADWKVEKILLDHRVNLPGLTGRLHQGDVRSLDAEGATNWDVRDIVMQSTALDQLVEIARSFGWKTPLPFAIKGNAAVKIPQLLVTDQGTSFPQSPELQLTQVALRLPQAAEAFVKWDTLLVQANPLTVMESGQLDRLWWDKPQVFWSSAVLAAFASLVGQTTEPATAAATAPAPASAPASGASTQVLPTVWQARELRVQAGKLQLKDWGEGFPNIRSDVEIHTAALQEGGEPFYHLKLGNPAVRLGADETQPPIYQGLEATAVLHPQRIWTRQSLEQVSFRESRIDIGATAADAYLLTIPNSETPAIAHELPVMTGQEPGEADAVDLPEGWHIRSLSLQSTRVHLHRLIPDLPEIVLPISYKNFKNMPLEPQAMAQHEEPLRLEIPMVHLPGTRAGTSVADLDTNFLHFRLSGLLQQEIDRVQLVNPKIYVGDSLFHYIDKLRSESTSPDPARAGIARLALALFAQLGGESLPITENPGTGSKPKAWTIKKLQAVNGKLVTTVKDSPLIHVPPLPFGAESSLQDSEINAELAIPPGLYKPILGMELVAALKGGSIKFNLPRKQEANNLVQVFEADWLRFKQLRLSEVKLSVTYDEFGIYAQFWAQAYGGYIQGAFNLYLTDNLSWDGWVSLANVDTTDLTKVLTPASFTMQGKLTGTLVAQGDKSSLYQATGQLRSTQAGEMKILALEDVIKSIPKDWDDARRKWTIKALETVRDFRYDQFVTDLRFYGIEGNINLKLTGPDGARNFEIHSHDRRVRVTE